MLKTNRSTESFSRQGRCPSDWILVKQDINAKNVVVKVRQRSLPTVHTRMIYDTARGEVAEVVLWQRNGMSRLVAATGRTSNNDTHAATLRKDGW